MWNSSVPNIKASKPSVLLEVLVLAEPADDKHGSVSKWTVQDFTVDLTRTVEKTCTHGDFKDNLAFWKSQPEKEIRLMLIFPGVGRGI